MGSFNGNLEMSTVLAGHFFSLGNLSKGKAFNVNYKWYTLSFQLLYNLHIIPAKLPSGRMCGQFFKVKPMNPLEVLSRMAGWIPQKLPDLGEQMLELPFFSPEWPFHEFDSKPVIVDLEINPIYSLKKLTWHKEVKSGNFIKKWCPLDMYMLVESHLKIWISG